jgi:hypothetical protein
MSAITSCRMKRNVIGPPGRSKTSRQMHWWTSAEKPYQISPRTPSATSSTTAAVANSTCVLVSACAITSH